MDEARFCTECGASVAGLSFCVRCGHPVQAPAPAAEIPPPAPPAPVPPAPAQLPVQQPVSPAPPLPLPLPPDPAPGKRHGKRWAIPAAVVLLLLLCAAGGYLWARDRGEEKRATNPTTTSTPTADGTTEGATTEGGSATTATSSPSPTSPPTSSAPPKTLTCWTGKKVATPRDCRKLGGRQALDWVFPNLEDLATCGFKAGSRARKFVRTCEFGGERRFTATQWWKFAGGDRYYSTTLGAAHLEGGRWRWDPIYTGSQWKTAFMYVDTGFGITIYADSRAALDALVSQVKLRSPRAVADAAAGGRD